MSDTPITDRLCSHYWASSFPEKAVRAAIAPLERSHAELLERLKAQTLDTCQCETCILDRKIIARAEALAKGTT